MKSRILVLALPLLLASCSVDVVPKTSDSRSQTTSSQAASESKPAESSEKEASSAKEDSSMIEESSEEKAPSFIEKEGTAYYVKSIFNETFKVRYYEGGHVAYISIKEFSRLLYRSRDFIQGRDRFDVVKEGDKYTTTVAGDYNAVFDVKNHTLHSDNLSCYKATALGIIGEESYLSYDGLPFLHIKENRRVGDKKDVSATDIDFAKYGMKIYGDDTDVYVPVTFATDLFSNTNILAGAWNGKDLYFFDYTANENPYVVLNANYWEAMFQSPIEQDQADFLYNELCLDYDILLGRPGRSSLEAYYDLSNGLDAALETRPLGRRIKELLHSTSVSDYMAGAYLLGLIRQDGGHTGYSPLGAVYFNSTQYVQPTWVQSNYSEFYAAVTSELSKKYDETTNACLSYSHHREIYDARNRVLGKEGTCYGDKGYTKVDDLAFIHVDGFMNEIECQNDWKDYYSGKRDDIPADSKSAGAVSITYRALKAIQQDPSINYIVLDLSANTGGSTDEMLTMISMFAGANRNCFYEYNRIADVIDETEYEIDRNLDRKFDEEDLAIDYTSGKKLAVLTTRNGFSCGGISPVYLHDYGLFTIGENCGGGSCSILIKPDAYGLNYRSSSPWQTYSPKFVNVDVAKDTSCDHIIDFPSHDNGEGGTYFEYDELFNVANLKTWIDAKYANK